MDKSYVTLEQCLFCNKQTGNLLMDKKLRNIFDIHTITGAICKECQKKVDKNISFSCHTCKSFHLVKIDIVKNKWGLNKIKPGEKYKTYQCPPCTENKSFVLLPPKK